MQNLYFCFMRLYSNKYLSIYLPKIIFVLLLSFGFALAANSQLPGFSKDSSHTPLSPLLLAALRKPVKPNPLIAERMKPSKYELMYWADYYLTQDQIKARYSKYNQPFASRVADDIISSYVNYLLYGKKTTPASIPKF